MQAVADNYNGMVKVADTSGPATPPPAESSSDATNKVLDDWYAAQPTAQPETSTAAPQGASEADKGLDAWLASQPAEKTAPKVDFFGDPVGHGLYEDVIAPAASAAVSGAASGAKEAFGNAPLYDPQYLPINANDNALTKGLSRFANVSAGD